MNDNISKSKYLASLARRVAATVSQVLSKDMQEEEADYDGTMIAISIL